MSVLAGTTITVLVPTEVVLVHFYLELLVPIDCTVETEAEVEEAITQAELVATVEEEALTILCHRRLL